jgi:peptidoglycan/xylan/chitin deacetylase (PgdA/CDA1 family)
MAVGAAVTLVLLVVALASAFSAGAPVPAPTPAPTPDPSLVVQAAIAAVSPTAGSTPSPAVTAPPSLALPPAGSFPIIRSCNPASVPNAVAVATPAVGNAGSFVLKVPVLMYHRIVPFAEAGNSIRGLVVPPEVFSAQLDALEAAGWHTITMAQLAADLQAHLKPPPRTFVITIDDGWDDGYVYAYRVLAKHGFAATYFVIAGRIDTPDFLSSAHLRALIAAGDEIGDHTWDHANLARTTGDRLQFEIDAAAARIAQATGHWPESFAYPHGGVDTAAAAAVAACGELRTAVIEQVAVSDSPAASPIPAPNPTVGPTGAASGGAVTGATVPATAATSSPGPVPLVRETWADRWTISRLRVGPSTAPRDLLAELAPYA